PRGPGRYLDEGPERSPTRPDDRPARPGYLPVRPGVSPGDQRKPRAISARGFAGFSSVADVAIKDRRNHPDFRVGEPARALPVAPGLGLRALVRLLGLGLGLRRALDRLLGVVDPRSEKLLGSGQLLPRSLQLLSLCLDQFRGIFNGGPGRTQGGSGGAPAGP